YRLYFYFIFIEPGVLKIRPESMLIAELNPVELKALHNKTKSEVFSLQQYIEALESSYIKKHTLTPTPIQLRKPTKKRTKRLLQSVNKRFVKLFILIKIFVSTP